MTYPFLRSYTDLGIARGPRLAMCWHMAEGGGTVGYLSRANPRSVSVHFVVEYSGQVVQMLDLAHMHSSLRTSAIRTSDDPPYVYLGETITYGRSAAFAVMGLWADIKRSLGPNHASIAVEVEGFARNGPNPKQAAAIVALFDDMAGRYPGIRSLGHRDFADYKGCPGHKFPWPSVRGHGKAGAPAPVPPPAPPSVTLRYGGTLLTPRQVKRIAVPAGRKARVRTRPSTAAPIVAQLANGTAWTAYQMTRTGTLLAGSAKWYGDRSGTRWLHSSAF